MREESFKTIYEIFKSKPPEQNNMHYGRIISLNPLSVEIEEGVILPESMLFLGQMCRPHKVTIPHIHYINGITIGPIPANTGVGGDPAHNHSMLDHTHRIVEQKTENVHRDFDSVTLTIYPELSIGDIVLLFAFNSGQKYYVAERLEGKI